MEVVAHIMEDLVVVAKGGAVGVAVGGTAEVVAGVDITTGVKEGSELPVAVGDLFLLTRPPMP